MTEACTLPVPRTLLEGGRPDAPAATARTRHAPMTGGFEGLLQRAIDGEEGAFDALIGPLVEYGYRLAYTMLGSRDDAEDAVQEATVKAWSNLGRLKDGAAVRSWFLTIVANQCRSMRRGRWWSVLKVADPERHAAGPEDEAVRHTEMTRALARLSPDERLALQLRYYMDLRLDEVAAVLGVSETAAKSRIHRATQRLRPGLEVPEGLRP